MYIRAAYVDLKPSNLRSCCLIGLKTSHRLHIVIYRKSAHICHYRLMENLCQLWKFLCNYRINSRVLKSHCIYHSVRTFCNSRCWISEARLQCGSFKGESSKTVYVVKFRKLVAVTEGAGSGNYRVVKCYAAKACLNIYHMISSLSRTGPSLQILLFPYFVLHEHPMQAPNPQPILSSKLYWPEVFAMPSIALNIGIGPQVKK